MGKRMNDELTLSKILKEDDYPVKLDRIMNLYRERGGTKSVPEVKGLLMRLESRGVIRKTGGEHMYSFYTST